MSATEPTYEQQLVSQRAKWITGWRDLLDWLEQNPHVPLTHDDAYVLGFHTDKDELVATAAAMGAEAEKSIDAEWFNVTITFGPISYRAYARHELVCSKVVAIRETEDFVCDVPALAQIRDRGEQS